MPSLIFNSCCGCINLRTGCFIIGYLELVEEILYSIGAASILALGGVVAAHHDDKDVKKEDGLALLVIGVILILIMAVLLAFTILLLVGLHKNKRGFVKAYLIYKVIFLVLGLVLWLASFAQPQEVSKVISSLITLLIHIYFMLVIRSYYHKMEENKERPYNNA